MSWSTKEGGPEGPTDWVPHNDNSYLRQLRACCWRHCRAYCPGIGGVRVYEVSGLSLELIKYCIRFVKRRDLNLSPQLWPEFKSDESAVDFVFVINLELRCQDFGTRVHSQRRLLRVTLAESNWNSNSIPSLHLAISRWGLPFCSALPPQPYIWLQRCLPDV